MHTEPVSLQNENKAAYPRSHHLASGPQFQTSTMSLRKDSLVRLRNFNFPEKALVLLYQSEKLISVENVKYEHT